MHELNYAFLIYKFLQNAKFIKKKTLKNKKIVFLC